MIRLSRAILTRRRDGRWDLHLDPGDREVLARLGDQVAQLVGDDPGDPMVRRLFPTAYADDPDREQEWRLLMGEDLRTRRLAQLAVLRSTAESTVLTDDEAQEWMQALNAVRLVLGTRLDVSEDDVEPDPDDPEAAAHAVYHYLGYLLERTVTSLSKG